MKKIIFTLLFLVFTSIVADAASRFAVCTTTCTWDNSSTAMWSASSGGATGASFPVAGDAVTLDAATCVGGTTCTITVNANLAMTSLTMGACTASTAGCILDFSANNNTVTISGTFSASGTGTRTLNMGNNVWTFTNTAVATLWTISTGTNMTLNANSSTISFTGNTINARAAIFGSFTYATVTFGANTTSGGSYKPSVFTAATINVTGPNTIAFADSLTSVTNLNINGTAGNFVDFTSNNTDTQRSMTVSSLTANFTSFRGIAMLSGSNLTANNSFDAGFNTGFSINLPGGSKIIGGTLLNRDLHNDNDNSPAFLNQLAMLLK